MPSTAPEAEVSPIVNARQAQRLLTRARLFDAAVAEIGRSGLAGTDVATIAAATGVARGTFYFHFPTKEHVLAELERTEEARIVAKLAKASRPRDLTSMLTQLVRQVLAAEERLGPVVFRDMLGLHFSPTRPIEDETAEHPLAEFVIAAIGEAQAAQGISRDADAGQLGVIFMTGLFALLATSGASKSRAALLDRYVKTIIKGMEAP
ncbi:TetR/AcrR family transcriptional regulator [Mycobacterium montefiorense]|uniref:TetR family transcriptional regulator n=1 Tax=Mycobacterium montefiorense TaxID=154654 RepID=A0AA37UTC8_9MYCO|nr:TetR/AcrR family transcriptional regulator [Mycobacterium montefiorense]GBG38770.1 TetR family transcriptional regulator [Mycobacterium montefiorense]GKU34598.1 TetR family transcriptional regulator [Mycobacterium montefiorense]GKU39218.1 TetR family transcriptional regulator [Mycobacterium montefiorense]GKU43643.1 TetR family transcriptional regulator [Mycobacterium montefiorense]GKU49983.1 TetR family transcriptional regulator [Mycobacterium montefiorense]